jgi:hypothetical protein
MIKYSYIYDIIDPLKNLPVYVGSAENVHARAVSHITSAKSKKPNKSELHKWLNSMILKGHKVEFRIYGKFYNDGANLIEYNRIEELLESGVVLFNKKRTYTTAKRDVDYYVTDESDLLKEVNLTVTIDKYLYDLMRIDNIYPCAEAQKAVDRHFLDKYKDKYNHIDNWEQTKQEAIR